jgi:L-ascorbate 6-phosphate lactonase
VTLAARPGFAPNWRPPFRTVGIQWLGQSGFVLTGNRSQVLIDVYLSSDARRRAPPPVSAIDLTMVTLVLATHEHRDHLDLANWPLIAEASPVATFVVPGPLVASVQAAGIPRSRMVGAEPGVAFEVQGVGIVPLPSCHGITPGDAYTFGRELSDGAVRYLGYVVDIDGLKVYHAGDTISYAGQAELVRSTGARVALLPINGRDADRERRGIVGNLDSKEAAALAVASGVELAIPMHYDLIEGNLADPASFISAVDQLSASVSCVVLAGSRRMLWPISWA